MERHEQDMQSYPLVVKDGRVVSGYLPLVPVTPKSQMCIRDSLPAAANLAMAPTGVALED